MDKVVSPALADRTGEVVLSRKQNTRSLKLNKCSARVAGVIAIIAGVVLAGWFLNAEILTRISPGLVAMNPTTAVAFLLSAICLKLSSGRRDSPRSAPNARWVKACASVILMIGVAKIAGVIFKFDSGVDRLFFTSRLNDVSGGPNHMAPNTALNFILVGCAFLFLEARKPRVKAWACLFAIVSGFEGLLAVLGYTYRIHSFYGVGSFIPMSLHTALSFVLLSGGIILCQPQRGLLSVIGAPNTVGAMARRLLPAAILVPGVVGWLRLEGERFALYDAEFGIALYTVLTMLVLSGIICCNAAWLFRAELKRTKAERRLKRIRDELEARVLQRTAELSTTNAALQAVRTELEEHVRERSARLAEAQSMLHRIVDQATSIIYVKDLAGRFLLVNRQLSSLLGLPEAEIIGRSGHDLYPSSADAFRANDLAALQAAGPVEFEESLSGPDGLHIFVSSKFPLRDHTGEVYALGCVSTDITARKRWEQALRDNEQRLEAAIHANQLIMDNSKDVICTVDKAGLFVTVSAASKVLWGYAPEELVSKPYLTLVYPEDVAKTEVMAAQIMAGNPASNFENRCVRKDGSIVHVLWSSYWSETDQKIFAVLHDITERAHASEALRQAEVDANRANRAKSEFLSRMSHELRTPMNAILGFAQLLEMDKLTPEQHEGVGHILRGGRHLLDLINEVLDISRIEAGRLSLSLEPVDLGEILKESFDLVQALAQHREVRLLAPGGFGCFVLGDRQRLKQVLINLLSNAVKYNRLGGTVTVTCDDRAECTRISISDTGVGIPEEKRSQLFVPFERLGAEQSAIEGTGLGLALAKRLVEAMGGTMGLESTFGHGSTFWLELPTSECPIKQAELTDFTPASELSDGSERTVLYIEDNLSNLRLIERLLERRPAIKLVAANTGAAGLQIARQHRPDLLLLDLNLPDITGHEVLLQLRAEEHGTEVPVIVLSADATPGQIARLKEAGALDYLTKPLDVRKFYEVLDGALIERRPA